MLMFLNVVAAAFIVLGLASIGWGLTIVGFSFSDTVVISGVVAVTGGVVTLALGRVIALLEQIADGQRSGVLPREVTLPSPHEAGEPRLDPLMPFPAALRRDPPAVRPAEVDVGRRAVPALRPEAVEKPEVADRSTEEKLLEVLSRPIEVVVEKAPAAVASAASASASAVRSRRPEPAIPPADRVLKSGEINGMPYTLFADGSIEAQVQDGPRRFNSIRELREFVGV